MLVVKIQNQQRKEGIIEIDLIMTFSSALGTSNQTFKTTTPTSVSRLEFELTNDTFKVIEIGTIALAPTVNANVQSFRFDPNTKSLDVLDANNTVIHHASTDNNTLLVRVDFDTATITVFQ